MMTLDPIAWNTQYRENESFRLPNSNLNTTSSIDATQGKATKIYIFGDDTNDTKDIVYNQVSNDLNTALNTINTTTAIKKSSGL